MKNFDQTATTLQPVFEIMQQFKNDLLKAGNPLTFIKTNLLDTGMLPVHPDNKCDFDNDGNITFGSLVMNDGLAAIDIEVCKDKSGTNCTYYVFADKFNMPTVYVTYDNTGKPTELCFGYDNLPDYLNSVFYMMGQVTNKDNYEIKMGDYLIDVYIDTDCFGNMYDVEHCAIAIYITLKF